MIFLKDGQILGDIMASTRRRKLKKLRMKKANHGKRPLAGK